MKKVSLLIVFVLVVGLIWGCNLPNNDVEEVRTIKVGITMYNEFDPFTEQIRHNIENNLTQIADRQNVEIVTTTVYSSQNQLVQNDQVEDFIEKGYDIICVNLVDRTDPSVIIETAKSTDTPIVFFNRELVEDDLKRFDKLYYVGAEPEESGRIQGELVLSALEKRFDEIDISGDGVIQYILLEGEVGHQDAIIRSRVSVETILDGGIELERLGDEIANWDRKQAQTKVTSLLQGYPRQIELVIANDDNMALGAVDAMKIFRVQNMPLIVGVNGDQEVLKYISDGVIEGTALNNAEAKGRVIAEMAYGIAANGNVPDDIKLIDGKYYYVPYIKIDRSNVKEYMEE